MQTSNFLERSNSITTTQTRLSVQEFTVSKKDCQGWHTSHAETVDDIGKRGNMEENTQFEGHVVHRSKSNQLPH